MTNQIMNGYLIVSAREYMRYRGVDREPWETIDAAYYTGDLPEDLRRLYENMRAGNKRGVWWPTSSSRGDVARLLAFSQTREARTEVIAIYSPYLREIGREDWTDASAEFLGIDVVSVGEWSLLQLLERSAIALPEHIAVLVNDAGLLSEALAVQYVQDYYRELSEQGRIEPIANADSRIPVEPVHVYLVDIQSDSSRDQIC